MKKVINTPAFPSTQLTIQVDDDDTYGGAHRYHFNNCLGFNDGQTQYENSSQSIQFVHKADDGTITPGLQSEQLVIALLDRHEKLNARYPSPYYPSMKAGLEVFLNACQARVQDRMNHNVMGDLKK